VKSPFGKEGGEAGAFGLKRECTEKGSGGEGRGRRKDRGRRAKVNGVYILFTSSDRRKK